VGGKLQHGGDLLAGERILFHQFFNRHAVLQVLKHDRNRRPCVFEHPCAAHLAGDAFDGGALGPVERGHFAKLHFTHLHARRTGFETHP
jgi:hypothetical protein